MIEEHPNLAELFKQLKSLQLKDNTTPLFADNEVKDIRLLLESCFNFLIKQASNQNVSQTLAETLVPQNQAQQMIQPEEQPFRYQIDPNDLDNTYRQYIRSISREKLHQKPSTHGEQESFGCSQNQPVNLTIDQDKMMMYRSQNSQSASQININQSNSPTDNPFIK